MYKKYYSMMAILMILALGLIFFAIRSSVREIKNDKAMITSEKENLKELLAKGQDMITSRKNLALIESNLDMLGDPFLKTGDELKFITDLEKIAAENRVEQQMVFDNGDGSTEGEIKTVPIDINLNGSLDNIMGYINGLEKLNYYINIKKININSSGATNTTKKAGQQTPKEKEIREDAGSEVLLSVNLAALTYWK